MTSLRAMIRNFRERRAAKREVAEVKQHRDLVPLTPGEAHTREVMLVGAQDRGEMVAMVGTENRIAQMVAEQTRGFRKQIGDLEGHISTLSQRIMYLENPNRPKLGEVGSGTGVFPRPRASRIVSGEPEVAGRPSTVREAAAEMLKGEGAREVPPSQHPMRRNDEANASVDRIARDPRGKFISKDAKTDPYLQTR